jgi:hypothetical protein
MARAACGAEARRNVLHLPLASVVLAFARQVEGFGANAPTDKKGWIVNTLAMRLGVVGGLVVLGLVVAGTAGATAPPPKNPCGTRVASFSTQD